MHQLCHSIKLLSQEACAIFGGTEEYNSSHTLRQMLTSEILYAYPCPPIFQKACSVPVGRQDYHRASPPHFLLYPLNHMNRKF